MFSFFFLRFFCGFFFLRSFLPGFFFSKSFLCQRGRSEISSDVKIGVKLEGISETGSVGVLYDGVVTGPGAL